MQGQSRSNLMWGVVGIGLLLGGCREISPVARVSVSPGVLELNPGQRVELELEWQMVEGLGAGGERPIVFLHLLDSEGRVLRTFDHPLPEPWSVGTTQRYRVPVYQSALGPALDPGTYRLTLGLYDGALRRWNLDGGEDVGRQEYALATVEVPTSELTARVEFSEAFLETELGSDAQTLARRWMVAPGEFVVDELPEATEALWVRLWLPKAGGPLRLHLDEGVIEPTVRVASECGGFEAILTGSGHHEFQVPVAGTGCRLRLDSNYTLVETTTDRRRILAIEQLAWR